MRKDSHRPLNDDEHRYIISYSKHRNISKAYQEIFGKSTSYCYEFHKRVLINPEANRLFIELESARVAYISPDNDMTINQIAGVLTGIIKRDDSRDIDRLKAIERLLILTDKDKEYKKCSINQQVKATKELPVVKNYNFLQSINESSPESKEQN